MHVTDTVPDYFCTSLIMYCETKLVASQAFYFVLANDNSDDQLTFHTNNVKNLYPIT